MAYIRDPPPSGPDGFPSETGTIFAVGRWTGMVGCDCSGILRRNDVTMRRQGQEERVAALEVHPLEDLSFARLAGLDGNFAGLASRPNWFTLAKM